MQKLAAKDGGLSEEKIRAKLDDLVALLPDIKARLPSLKPEIILRLVKDTDAVAQKLLQLKCAFPGADCGRMLVKEMALMRETAESLARRAQALRAFLPAADIDAIAQVRDELRHCIDACSAAALIKCGPVHTAEAVRQCAECCTQGTNGVLQSAAVFICNSVAASTVC